MSKVQELWAGLRRWKYLPTVLVIISYFFFTFYYMAPSIIHCTDTVNGFGDSTGGPIWSSQQSGGEFMPQKTDATNYPVGDQLYTPVHWAAMGQRVMLWTFSQVAGPVCGYNIMNVVGFMSTALLMFSFIYWLIKRPFIAWLAGFLVAFSPFLQLKAGAHPSYGYIGVMIAVLWLAILSIYGRGRWHKVLLAGLLAFAAYFDPYFILFGVVVMLSVAAGYLFSATGRLGKKLRTLLRAWLPPFVLFLVLVSPLGGVFMLNRAQIASSTNGARGSSDNIRQAAIMCSNYPFEYFVPNEDNYILNGLTGGDYRKDVVGAGGLLRKDCGGSEDNVYVGLTLSVSVAIFLVIVVWERFNRRRLRLDSLLNGGVPFHARNVLIIALSLVFIASIFALPALLLFDRVPTPSRVLVDITSLWRVFSRLYLLVLTGLVIVFSFGLAFFSGKFKNRKHTVVLFVILLGLILIDYQVSRPLSGTPFGNFSYARDTPQVYKDLAADSSVKTIAEYPMERIGETDAPVYYVTMQATHKKRLLNSYVPNSENEQLRYSLKDLTDPQTLPVLRAIGVDRLVVHGLTLEEINGVAGIEVVSFYDRVNSGLSRIRQTDNQTIALVRIADDVIPATYALEFGKTFGVDPSTQKTPIDGEQESIDGAVINAVAIPGHTLADGPYTYCFDVRSVPASDGNELTVMSADGDVLYQGLGAQQGTSLRVTTPKDKIVIKNQKGHNLRFDNLGCGR